MKRNEDRCRVRATNSWPKPADFPLGSLESRAAARTMAKTRAELDTKKPYVYQAHFDEHAQPLEPQEIYDYWPVSEAPARADKSPQPQSPQPQENAETRVPDALPAPGESLDDPPTPQD